MYVLHSLVFLERTPPLFCIQRPFGTTFGSDIHGGQCASVFFFSTNLVLCHLCPELLWKSVPDSVMNVLSFSFIVDQCIESHSRIILGRFWLPPPTSSSENMKTYMCDVSCRLSEGGRESKIKKQTFLLLCCRGTEYLKKKKKKNLVL